MEELSSPSTTPLILVRLIKYNFNYIKVQKPISLSLCMCIGVCVCVFSDLWPVLERWLIIILSVHVWLLSSALSNLIKFRLQRKQILNLQRTMQHSWTLQYRKFPKTCQNVESLWLAETATKLIRQITTFSFKKFFNADSLTCTWRVTY